MSKKEVNQQENKSLKSSIIEWVKVFGLAIILAFVITLFIKPTLVRGDSMVPTLKEGQILLLNKYTYRFNDIKRNDIIVIKVGKSEIIKRVIGLPGETIEYKDNILYINGEAVEDKYNTETGDFTLKGICNCDKIPEGKYLVLGDNRVVSSDSRIIGLIDKKEIIGKTSISLWPIKKIN